MSNSHLHFAFVVLFLVNVLLNSMLNVKQEQIKQERNDAIVFCVENPTDCKAEYLKLR